MHELCQEVFARSLEIINLKQEVVYSSPRESSGNGREIRIRINPLEEIFGKGFYRRRGRTVAVAFSGGAFCQIADDGMAVFPWNHLRK